MFNRKWRHKLTAIACSASPMLPSGNISSFHTISSAAMIPVSTAAHKAKFKISSLHPFVLAGRRKFCVDHRVSKLQNYAPPCSRNVTQCQDYSNSAGPNFLKNLQICMDRGIEFRESSGGRPFYLREAVLFFLRSKINHQQNELSSAE